VAEVSIAQLGCPEVGSQEPSPHQISTTKLGPGEKRIVKQRIAEVATIETRTGDARGITLTPGFNPGLPG
jgi:hypothetical protein